MKINDLNKFCKNLGEDPTLVQGAGGNISLKEDDILFIKGSGKWIANALEENIFAELPLIASQEKLFASSLQHNFSQDSLNTLRPSIETAFHLMIDSKIVLHLHDTFALSILIMSNYKDVFSSLLGDMSHACIDYAKPGKDLAKKLYSSIKTEAKKDLYLLQNHGIILSSDSIKEIYKTLMEFRRLIKSFLEKSYKSHAPDNRLPGLAPQKSFSIKNKLYKLISQEQPCKICSSPLLLLHLQKHWAYSPDHVVFLGRKPNIFSSLEEAIQGNTDNPLVFIKDLGIYYSGKNTLSVIDQLDCFKKVFLNLQESNLSLNILNSRQIDELLNWDEEIFRQSLSK